MKHPVLALLFASTVSCAQASSPADPPLSVYDGFWIGTISCTGLVTPGNNPKANDPFTVKLTFNMTQGQALARLENDVNVNNYRLSLTSAGQAEMHYTGNSKANANRAWLVRAEGRVVGGDLLLKGPMTTADKATVLRESCMFELRNDDVVGNIQRHQASLKAKATPTPAPVKAAPAPAAKKPEPVAPKAEPKADANAPAKPVKPADGF